MLTTAHGIRIACLGGVYDSNVYTTADSPQVSLSIHVLPAEIPSGQRTQGFTSPYFTAQTVEKLLANTLTTSKPKEQNYNSLAAIKSSSSSSQLVDILISNVWPSDITNFSSAPLPAPELASIRVEPVTAIVRKTKPRYHLAAGGGHPPKFWEREPYVWDEDNGRVSRFVSLGAFGGEQGPGKKPRVSRQHTVFDWVEEAHSTDRGSQWFYAFSIAPLTPATPNQPKPANVTTNPFLHRPPKRPLDAGLQPPEKRSRTGGLVSTG